MYSKCSIAKGYRLDLFGFELGYELPEPPARNNVVNLHARDALFGQYSDCCLLGRLCVFGFLQPFCLVWF